jgi:hypothetical protein
VGVFFTVRVQNIALRDKIKVRWRFIWRKWAALKEDTQIMAQVAFEKQLSVEIVIKLASASENSEFRSDRRD